jgi:hypothetical protein
MNSWAVPGITLKGLNKPMGKRLTMALSPKHYVAVAEILSEKSKRELATIHSFQVSNNNLSPIDATVAVIRAEIKRDMISEIGEELIKLFKADNPNFNTVTFRKAAALPKRWAALIRSSSYIGEESKRKFRFESK